MSGRVRNSPERPACIFAWNPRRRTPSAFDECSSCSRFTACAAAAKRASSSGAMTSRHAVEGGSAPTGTCPGLENAFALVIQRVEEDEKLVRDLLAKPDFKVDENIELVVDTDIRGRPKTQQERSELLRKLVHFQLANLMLTDIG